MSRYLARLKELTQSGEKPLPEDPTKPPKAPFVSFGGCVGRCIPESEALSDDEEIEVEERAGIAMGSVPELYLDAWARLQVQRPATVPDDEWWRAVNDAGLFLDRWGAHAVQFVWSPANQFNVPRDGSQGGLVWFLRGEPVRAFGPEHAITESGRVFDRGRPTHAPCIRT
jgi:hypothetical protein